MYKGYELALKRNSPVTFKFKGVETTLHPDQQAVDDAMIDIRIKDLIKELNRVSSVSVKNCIFSYSKQKKMFSSCFSRQFSLNVVFLLFQTFRVPEDIPAQTVESTSSRENPKSAKPLPEKKGKTPSSEPCSKEMVASTSKTAVQVEIDEEIPEFKEKKRLLAALMECDKQIHTLECSLLNLHDGKVRAQHYIYIIYYYI